ncbi:hypothetical protein [Paramagnetospirillum marisnigri]|uniref:hypothetical protein n=1 Tax=Paramagnetospirillum marisnigri TaxID=1285242 RepID=UPI001FE1C977|nr:hypothetical protein [Paramagnetospirillum marisnigri]
MTEPFATVEEAWLWYVRCQAARDDGARFIAGLGMVARPCEPDDIAREVRRLAMRRVLRPAHLHVLGHLVGRAGRPDPWSDDPAAAALLWDEALDRLATPLKRKGIVA